MLTITQLHTLTHAHTSTLSFLSPIFMYVHSLVPFHSLVQPFHSLVHDMAIGASLGKPTWPLCPWDICGTFQPWLLLLWYPEEAPATQTADDQEMKTHSKSPRGKSNSTGRMCGQKSMWLDTCHLVWQ